MPRLRYLFCLLAGALTSACTRYSAHARVSVAGELAGVEQRLTAGPIDTIAGQLATAVTVCLPIESSSGRATQPSLDLLANLRDQTAVTQCACPRTDALSHVSVQPPLPHRP